jgi:hypothetical protein
VNRPNLDSAVVLQADRGTYPPLPPHLLPLERARHIATAHKEPIGSLSISLSRDQASTPGLTARATGRWNRLS